MLDVRVFFGGIEGGAGLGGEIPVTVDAGMWEVGTKAMEERAKGGALLRRAGVPGCATIRGDATDVADAERMGVVARAMGTDLCDGTTDVDRAVAIDHIVIADGAVAPLAMPTGDVRNGVVLALRRGRTMDDDFLNLSHGYSTLIPLSLMDCFSLSERRARDWGESWTVQYEET